MVIVDDIINSSILSSEEKMTELFWWLGLAVILFVVLRPPIEFYRQYLAQNLSNNILFDIRKELYGHLQRLSLKYYSNTRAGEVISRVINDVEQTKNFVIILIFN